MKTNTIDTELEALEVCKENGFEIKFWPRTDSRPSYVEVKSNAWTKVRAWNFVEAVSRIVELENTIPAEKENLSWWSESEQIAVM